MTEKNDEADRNCRGAALDALFAHPPHAADIAAGKEKAELCVGCHGESGISQMENIPSLAAQPDLFIQWQLVFFRAGTRKNEQMQPIVEQLNNDDIRNLGAYFASLPPPKNPKPDDNPDLSAKGAQAAAGRRCANCHTDSYAGTKAVSRIAGQREDYLVKALRDYKSRRAFRRRHGGDGGGRLSAERGRDRGAGALSGAFVNCSNRRVGKVTGRERVRWRAHHPIPHLE